VPYEILDDAARRLVVAKVTGTFDAKEIGEVVAAARARSRDLGWNLLYDMRQSQPGNMGTSDLFWMPRKAAVLQDAAAYRTRVAMLHPPQFAQFAQFWETAFSNAGLQVRAFSDEAEALAWLGS
jgi:hypothetical protein